MDTDVRRRAGRLLTGILVCAVVIGLCVAVLVFLVDRFWAPAGDDCRRTHCAGSLARVGG